MRASHDIAVDVVYRISDQRSQSARSLEGQGKSDSVHLNEAWVGVGIGEVTFARSVTNAVL